MLIIHDDHFVNFDFRCYPPFCLLIGKAGQPVIDPAESRKSAFVYKEIPGKTCARASWYHSTSRLGRRRQAHVYRVDEELSVRMLKDSLQWVSTCRFPPTARWTNSWCGTIS
jgi:hypothetical protein